MQITAINATGQMLQAAGLKNPATLPNVPAGGKTANFDSDPDLFGGSVKSVNELWYKLVTPNPGLKAFFLSGDFINNTAMVGAEETGTLLSDFILPAVRPNYSNYVSLINPLPIQASVTLKLIANSGEQLESIDRSIPRYGLLQKGIDELFGSGLGRLGSVGGAYIRVTSLTAIRGYQLMVHQSKRDPAGLNAQSAVTGPSSLTFSHFVAGRDSNIGVDYETRVALINLDSTPQNLTLRIRDENGNEIAPAQQQSLPANGRVEPDLRQLFNLPTQTLTQGWLKVDGTGRLAGYVSYATNEAFAAVVSLVEPRTQLTFSHVAESPFENTNGYFTGLAIVNTNAEPTTAKISVYGLDGKLIASSDSFEILPGGRKVGLLRETRLVGPDVINKAGYVVVTSSLPVHGLEIFGTLSMKAFANVPAQ
jgi:hypothetical protein